MSSHFVAKTTKGGIVDNLVEYYLSRQQLVHAGPAERWASNNHKDLGSTKTAGGTTTAMPA